MGLRFRIPVFLDLVWEEHRSPLIASITVLRLFILVYVYLLLAFGYGLFNPLKTCADVRGARIDSDADGATFFLYFFSTALAALASCHAQSRVWLTPALLCTATYAILVLVTQAPSCVALMSASVGDADGIVVVILAVFDIVFTLLALVSLVMLVLQDPGAAIGRPASAIEASGGVSHVRSSVERARKVVALGSGAAAQWLATVYRGILVAPLRHHLAVILAVTFCLSTTIVCAILSTSSRQWQESAFDQFRIFYNTLAEAYNDAAVDRNDDNPVIGSLLGAAKNILDFAYDATMSFGLPAIQASCDVLWASSVAAIIACVLVVVSVSMSYAAMFADWARLAEQALPSELEPLKSTAARSDVETGETLGAPLLEEPGEQSKRPSPPSAGATSPIARFVTACVSLAPVYCADGFTLNLTGGAFSYLNAASYAALYVMNLVTIWALVTLMFTTIVFYFTSNATRTYGITTAIVFVFNWVYAFCFSRLYACCIARGTRIFHPRALLTMDLFMTVTLGVASGVTSGLVRFVLGVVRLLVEMTMLNRPLVPPPFATLDSGFQAYGGMVMAAWAAEIDSSLRQQPLQAFHEPPTQTYQSEAPPPPPPPPTFMTPYLTPSPLLSESSGTTPQFRKRETLLVPSYGSTPLLPGEASTEANTVIPVFASSRGASGR